MLIVYDSGHQLVVCCRDTCVRWLSLDVETQRLCTTTQYSVDEPIAALGCCGRSSTGDLCTFALGSRSLKLYTLSTRGASEFGDDVGTIDKSVLASLPFVDIVDGPRVDVSGGATRVLVARLVHGQTVSLHVCEDAVDVFLGATRLVRYERCANVIVDDFRRNGADQILLLFHDDDDDDDKCGGLSCTLIDCYRDALPQLPPDPLVRSLTSRLARGADELAKMRRNAHTKRHIAQRALSIASSDGNRQRNDQRVLAAFATNAVDSLQCRIDANGIVSSSLSSSNVTLICDDDAIFDAAPPRLDTLECLIDALESRSTDADKHYMRAVNFD
jgi:hypothetical protein